VDSARHIGDIIANVEDAGQTNEIQEAILNELEDPTELSPSLILTGVDFVNFLAGINIILRSVGARNLNVLSFQGNSRDTPSMFMFRCTKTSGCVFQDQDCWSEM